ncbi:MAG: DNA-binding protein [Streptomyces sp.]|nr:DNA-binding protein [Streptomyces sp.]
MTKSTEWREQIGDGLTQLQQRSVPRYHATEQFRVYSSTLVPGLLQTEQYAAAVLRNSARFHEVAQGDSAEAARARVERSRVIHAPGRLADFVIEESVLRCQIADPDVMTAQLGYVMTADALAGVSIGIIPSTAHERVWPRETFHIFDDTIVTVELVSSSVEVIQPSEIDLYVKAYGELRNLAVYGTQARELIVGAIESLH